MQAQYALSKCVPLKDKSYKSYESYLRIACTLLYFCGDSVPVGIALGRLIVAQKLACSPAAEYLVRRLPAGQDGVIPVPTLGLLGA